MIRLRTAGNTTNSALAPTLLLFLAGSQCVCAQNPSKTDIDFEQVSYQQVREGYLTLQWNRVEGAVRYEVVDEQEAVAFVGTSNQAFLSGLEDGRYRYAVRAFDEAGTLMVESSEFAEVHVEHWSMQLVGFLFAVGLVVVLAVATVLVVGARSSDSLSTGTGASRSEVAAG